MKVDHYPTDFHTEVTGTCACGYKVSEVTTRRAEDALAAHIAKTSDHLGERGDGYESAHF